MNIIMQTCVMFYEYMHLTGKIIEETAEQNYS